MPNITPLKSINIEEQLKELSLYKYHPNAIFNISLNRIKDMLDGKIEIVDPSNPFVYLIETSSINTAFAIKEFTLLMRKLYPRLANNFQNLYLHMSDYDYLGVYAEPSYADVTFNILYNDFISKAHYNSDTKEYTLKIPRHTKLNIDNYSFTIPNAIIIKQTETGTITVRYENESFNENLFPIKTNYINYNLYKFNQEETYIRFDVNIPEVDIEVVEFPVEKSKLFQDTIGYSPNKNFYYLRAFYYKDNQWKEMIVTHTNEVYDIYTPTCIIQVDEKEKAISYYIPPVYVNNRLIGNKVKFLIYTTSGYINVNFNDYKLSDYSLEYNNVFPDLELDEYTKPFNIITKFSYIGNSVIGGKNSLDFTELKSRVIDNSIGDRKLPITRNQLDFSISQQNFKLIRDVDIVTNRIFLLESDIPNAKTRYPITKVNLDIIEVKSTFNKLSEINSVKKIGGNKLIIPEGTLFKEKEGSIVLVDQDEYDNIKSLTGNNLVTTLNTNNYLSTFYHYVLDISNEEANLNAYELNTPKIKLVNFKDINSSLGTIINTTNTNIYKKDNGYYLDILCNVTMNNSAITLDDIKPVIIYFINDSRFIIEGNEVARVGSTPVYRFFFETDFFIEDKEIEITNFKDINNLPISVKLNLSDKFYVGFLSKKIPFNFVPTELETYIAGSYLYNTYIVVSLEEFSVEFGKKLEYLYRRVHSSKHIGEYKTYDYDVPMVYEHNVYDANNNIIHYKGEIVYDDNGEIIYQYRKGEYMLDSQGNMIPIGMEDADLFLNLLFIDYKINVCTDTDVIAYKNYIKEYLTTIIVDNASRVQDELLENTEAYVIVPKRLDYVKVKTGDIVKTIKSNQKFVLEVYLNEVTYNDFVIRENITYTITKEIENYLTNNKLIKKTELLSILFNKLKEFIINVNFLLFTELNSEVIVVLDENASLGINKIIELENNNYTLKEDIKILFKKI